MYPVPGKTLLTNFAEEFLFDFVFFKTGFLCVALTGLEFKDLFASVSQVLGPKACVTMHDKIFFFIASFLLWEDVTGRRVTMKWRGR